MDTLVPIRKITSRPKFVQDNKGDYFRKPTGANHRYTREMTTSGTLGETSPSHTQEMQAIAEEKPQINIVGN